MSTGNPWHSTEYLTRSDGKLVKREFVPSTTGGENPQDYTATVETVLDSGDIFAAEKARRNDVSGLGPSEAYDWLVKLYKDAVADVENLYNRIIGIEGQAIAARQSSADNKRESMTRVNVMSTIAGIANPVVGAAFKLVLGSAAKDAAENAAKRLANTERVTAPGDLNSLIEQAAGIKDKDWQNYGSGAQEATPPRKDTSVPPIVWVIAAVVVFILAKKGLLKWT